MCETLCQLFESLVVYLYTMFHLKTVIYGRPAKGVFDSQQMALFMGNYALGGDGQCAKALR